MTTYEAMSLLFQYSLSFSAGLTLVVTVVVLLNRKK